jgi:hypothetical protein
LTVQFKRPLMNDRTSGGAVPRWPEHSRGECRTFELAAVRALIIVNPDPPMAFPDREETGYLAFREECG